MRHLLGGLLLILLTAGCVSGGQRVTDFTDRSIAYGWIDIGDVDANRLHSVVLYQLQPQSETPYWNVKTVKLEGGYLFYAFSFPRGAFKLYEVSGQRCISILCGNSTFSYNFGKQGAEGATQIAQPGVYYLGALELEDVKTGFFQPNKFDVREAAREPSQRVMLEAMLKDAQELDPLLVERIQARLKQV